MISLHEVESRHGHHAVYVAVPDFSEISGGTFNNSDGAHGIIVSVKTADELIQLIGALSEAVQSIKGTSTLEPAWGRYAELADRFREGLALSTKDLRELHDAAVRHRNYLLCRQVGAELGRVAA